MAYSVFPATKRQIQTFFYRYSPFPGESISVHEIENFVMHLDYCTLKIL